MNKAFQQINSPKVISKEFVKTDRAKLISRFEWRISKSKKAAVKSKVAPSQTEDC